MRNTGVDSFRVIAMLFVIALHTISFLREDTFLAILLTQIARFSVPFFFIISGFYFYKNTNKKNAWVNLKSYLMKLVPIYVVWHCIYAILPLASQQYIVEIKNFGFFGALEYWLSDYLNMLRNHLSYTLLAGGKGFHLWFIPALLIALSGLAATIRYNFFKLGMLVSLTLFAIALLTAPYKPSSIGLPFSFEPRNGPFFSSLFVFLGAALAKCENQLKTTNAIVLAIFGLLMSLIEVFLIKNWWGTPHFQHNFVFSTIPLALGMSIYALTSSHLFLNRLAAKLAPSVLSVYVSHIFFMQLAIYLKLWPGNNLLGFMLVTSASFLCANLFLHVKSLYKHRESMQMNKSAPT